MPDKTFDAIVIGTGACGGWAAKELTAAGMETLVLDAGPQPEPSRDFTHHAWPYDLKYRGRPPEGRTEPHDHGLPLVWRKHPDHPYSTPPDKPFDWVRSRIVGGRTLHWSRATHRWSDYDFKAASRDGFGDDWPIGYSDIAPYYSQVERHIGVSGYKEGLPQLPDGEFLPGMPYNCAETMLRAAALRLGLPATHRRIAQLSRPLNGRPKCHFCGHCGDGCDVGAMFNSVVSTLPDAAATGKMTLRPNSIVRAVLTGKDGKAQGVSYVDRVTKQDYEARGRIIIVAASSLESTRILLNSAPDGLGNSSGVLGHYLMDQVAGSGVTGYLPQLYDGPPRNDDGKASGMFIPYFTNLDKPKGGKFLRGYCLSGTGGQSEVFGGAQAVPGYGAGFKKEVRRRYPAQARLWLSAGEMLPRYENFVALDPDLQDSWGIPALRITCEHSDNERALYAHAVETMKEVFEAAGGEIVSAGGRISTPGGLIHEVGTCRMGSDPKTSVLDPWCGMHETPNVYVFSGAPFVTSGVHHPTLTMMALTVRGCERIVEKSKRREL
ncbi:MAG: GMC family oxidoreductase [Acidobacteria bacterium]|nr:GMC family oxidoreductase [Acidobacteriota bacterium]